MKVKIFIFSVLSLFLISCSKRVETNNMKFMYGIKIWNKSPYDLTWVEVKSKREHNFIKSAGVLPKNIYAVHTENYGTVPKDIFIEFWQPKDTKVYGQMYDEGKKEEAKAYRKKTRFEIPIKLKNKIISKENLEDKTLVIEIIDLNKVKISIKE
jgi:hypothetical protein